MTTYDETAEAAAEQQRREEQLVARVLKTFESAPDERTKFLMQALTRHLHAFLREVRLTEDEWWKGIRFLTDTGHKCDEWRQEFVLLSDVFGASMQTIAINNEAYRDATEATVFGPFFVENSPEIEQGGDIAAGQVGEPCWVEGTVTDTEGRPVPGARIEVWEADADGLYDVQYEDSRTQGRAHLFSDDQGNYRFWGVTPTPYPIPHDGPVGALLDHVNRPHYRAAHLHFMVTADNLRTLVTHIFVRGDELLDHDCVFGVKDSLIRDFVRQEPGTPTPDGREIDGTWTRTRFDIVLAPAGQK